MQLYNKLSSDERSRMLDSSNQRRITLSFYKYAKINDPKSFRDELFIFWNSIDVLGRIYIASEGINAQLSLPEVNLEIFIDHLNSISFLILRDIIFYQGQSWVFYLCIYHGF